MIDVHCHLNFDSYKNDRDEVINEAKTKGVDIIINASTDLISSKLAVELAQNYNNLYAIIGVHPHNADDLEDNWDTKLLNIAKSSKKVIGIGEIGLDYYSHNSSSIVNPKIQKSVFIRQIEIASELKIPIQIHNRQAGSDILEILINHKSLIINQPPGMFHCMSGNLEFLKKVLNLGFYVGFDGNITYKGIAKGENTKLSDLVANTPIDKILTETDAPYLTPEPYRGSRNTPSRVIIVAEEIAKIKRLDINHVKSETLKNAHKLFNLKPIN